MDEDLLLAKKDMLKSDLKCLVSQVGESVDQVKVNVSNYNRNKVESEKIKKIQHSQIIKNKNKTLDVSRNEEIPTENNVMLSIRNLLSASKKNKENNILDKSDKDLDKSYENNRIQVTLSPQRRETDEKNQRGITVSNRRALSPQRRQQIKAMRNYQVFGRNLKNENLPLINARILPKEPTNKIKKQSTFKISDKADDISRMIINGHVQLIKNYLLPKITKFETVPTEEKRMVKVSKNGKVNLQDLCGSCDDSNFPNNIEKKKEQRNPSIKKIDQSFQPYKKKIDNSVSIMDKSLNTTNEKHRRKYMNTKEIEQRNLADNVNVDLSKLENIQKKINQILDKSLDEIYKQEEKQFSLHNQTHEKSLDETYKQEEKELSLVQS